MSIENANSHPLKVVEVEEGGPYANSHPYKVEVVGGGGGGTNNFNQLENRPKYDNQEMTGSTNIPAVVNTPFTGTDGASAGTAGLVPAPATTDTDKYLKSDGTWAEVQGGGGGTSNFNQLTNRPKYGVEEMTGDTVVPDPDIVECNIEYWPDVEESYEEDFAENCIVNSINQRKLDDFLAEYGAMDDWINFDYQPTWDPETGEPTGEFVWMYFGGEEEVFISPGDMEATTGISVTIEDPEMEWATLGLVKSLTVDTSDPSRIVSATGTCSIMDLVADSPTASFGFGEYNIYFQAIINCNIHRPAGYPSASYNVNIPSMFLAYTYNLQSLGCWIGSDHIGEGAFYGAGQNVSYTSVNFSNVPVTNRGDFTNVDNVYYYGATLSTSDKNSVVGAINELAGGGGGGSYIAGTGIDITDDTISVDTSTIQEKLTAGTGINITNNVISTTGMINGGTVAPTTATAGIVGTLYSYVDTTGATPEPHLMVCTVADTVTPSYTWVDILGNIATQLNIINNGGNS